MARKSLNIVDLINEEGTTGKLSDYADATNPKYIGPGIWSIMHRRARRLRTHEQQVQFIDFVKDICYGFPCKVCKGHCSDYIKAHPLEEFIDVYMEIDGKLVLLGLFVWTWRFHNSVNGRLSKPLMSWDTAYNLYTEGDTLICNKNCLGAETKQTQPVIYERTSKKPSKISNENINNLSETEKMWNASHNSRIQTPNYTSRTRKY